MKKKKTTTTTIRMNSNNFFFIVAWKRAILNCPFSIVDFDFTRLLIENRVWEVLK